jgi:hypothetical protein
MTSGYRPLQHRSRRERWSSYALLSGAIAITLGGVALLTSGLPLDPQGRRDLGAALLTGVIVGLALVGVERSQAARQSAALSEWGKAGLAELLAEHVWMLWPALLEVIRSEEEASLEDAAQSPTHADSQSRPEPSGDTSPDEAVLAEDPAAGPLGWKGTDDLKDCQRALVWARERMGQTPGWWHDPQFLASVDALTFVVSRLLGPVQPPPSSLEDTWAETVDRLRTTAERLSDAGDIGRAIRLDESFYALKRLRTRAYVPDRYGGFFDEDAAWLVDQLRDRPLALNSHGDPLESGAPPPESYRWGVLFNEGDDPSAALGACFVEGSWFRRILLTAGREIRPVFGVAPGTEGVFPEDAAS